MPVFSPKGTKYHGKGASSTKRGPGRFNKLRAYSRHKHSDFKKTGYPHGIETDARFAETGHMKQLSPAKEGGNWQGKGFLSYSEHDQITRKALETKAQYDTVLTHKGMRRALTISAIRVKTHGKER